MWNTIHHIGDTQLINNQTFSNEFQQDILYELFGITTLNMNGGSTRPEVSKIFNKIYPNNQVLNKINEDNYKTNILFIFHLNSPLHLLSPHIHLSFNTMNIQTDDDGSNQDARGYNLYSFMDNKDLFTDLKLNIGFHRFVNIDSLINTSKFMTLI